MKNVMTFKLPMILAGALTLSGLIACTEETPVQTEDSQAATEQSEQTGSTSTIASTESVTAPEPGSVQSRPSDSSFASPAEQAFSVLDANGDKRVSAEEAATNISITQDFAEIDLDQDGVVNLNEFLVYAGEAPAAGASPVEPDTSGSMNMDQEAGEPSTITE